MMSDDSDDSDGSDDKMFGIFGAQDDNKWKKQASKSNTISHIMGIIRSNNDFEARLCKILDVSKSRLYEAIWVSITDLYDKRREELDDDEEFS